MSEALDPLPLPQELEGAEGSEEDPWKEQPENPYAEGRIELPVLTDRKQSRYEREQDEREARIMARKLEEASGRDFSKEPREAHPAYMDAEQWAKFNRAKKRKAATQERHAAEDKFNRWLLLKAQIAMRVIEQQEGREPWDRGMVVSLLAFSDMTQWLGNPEREKEAVKRARKIVNDCRQAAYRNKAFQWWVQQKGIDNGGSASANPPIRLRYEEASAIGSLGGCLSATRNKSWGKFLGFFPLEPDDPYDGWRILYLFHTDSKYQQRFDQRKDLKKILGKARKLVGVAMGCTLTEFTAKVSREDEDAIKDKTGYELATFWRLVKGKELDPVLGEKSGRLFPLKTGLFTEVPAEPPGTPVAETVEYEAAAPPPRKPPRRREDLAQMQLFPESEPSPLEFDHA